MTCTGSTKNAACHASMHYVIDGQTGISTALVEEDNTAWAFQSYPGNFPVLTPLDQCQCPTPCPEPPCPQPAPATSYPGWPVQTGLHPNIAADFYTINIGITIPDRKRQFDTECCTTPYGISEAAYKTLVRLLKWIQFRYPVIQLNSQYIAFHDQIVDRPTEECLEFPCGPQDACLLCDVSNLCDKCLNAVDPNFIIVEGGIRYVLVETNGGCRAKITIDDFKTVLGL